MTGAGIRQLWKEEAEAHKRAMPMQRLVGNGMSYADASALFAAVDEENPWASAAKALGDANRARAVEAGVRHAAVTETMWRYAASACYRFGQVPLVDADPLKRELFEDLVSEFRAAADADGVSRVEVPYRDSFLSGWLRYPERRLDAPVVLIFGGFDGWREEYDSDGRALADRGVASCLIEVPGQAEARVLRGMTMSPDPDDVVAAIAAFIDVLRTEHGMIGPVGLWGNSMGGYLAARAASMLDEVAAVCVNSGSDRPAEILDRYPRFVTKFELMFGVDDPEQARLLGEGMRLTPETLATLRCPLLVLHGSPDLVLLVDSGRRVFEGGASQDKTWCEWRDGDHCIYNHTEEKHALVSDWFAERLVGSSKPQNSVKEWMY